MAKYARAVNSFLSGEMSPRMYGRTDADQYSQGAAELTNKMVRTQGGVWRRPGTQFLSDGVYGFNSTRSYSFAKGATVSPELSPPAIRMIPFKFSRLDSTIVFLTSTGGTNAIKIYLPASNTWVEPTFQLSAGYASFSGWGSQAELDEVQGAQSGDVIVLVSSKNPPIYLIRISPFEYVVKDIFSVRDVFKANRTPYTGTNPDVATQLSPSAPPNNLYYNLPYTLIVNQGTVNASATTGTVTLTATAYPVGNYVGSILRVTKAGVTGFVQITARTSDLVVTGNVLKTLGGTGVQDSFELQSWNPVAGWPRTVCFHDQRLMYGGTKTFPNTLWGSQVGDFTELMLVRPADDPNFSNLSNDRPYSYALASTVTNIIQWLASGKSTLFIGTLGDEWLGEPSASAILGPLNPNFSAETSYGSKAMQAINYNGSIIFCDKSGQHFREFIYNRSVDAYRAVDLNYYSEHLLRKGQGLYPAYKPPEIKQACVAQGNQNSVYALDSNGIVHVLAKEADYGVLGWSTLRFGGVSDAAGSPPIVKTMCVIPSVTGADEELYVLVQRLIRGETAIFFEKIGSEFNRGSLKVDSANLADHAVFSDSAMLVTQLKTPTFLARYRTTLNGEVALGAPGPLAQVGSPAVAANYLDLSGTGLKNVTYDPVNARVLNQGTIYFDFKPNYSGAPAADAHFFAISESAASTKNLIAFWHQASDRTLQFRLYNAAGETVFAGGVYGNAEVPVPWSPTAGEVYRFTIKYDFTSTGIANPANLRVFVNGQQTFFTPLSSIGLTGGLNRTTAIGQFVIGSDYTKTKYLNGFIKNFTLANEAPELSTTDGLRHAFVVDRYIVGSGHIDQGQLLGDGEYIGSFTPSTDQIPAQLAARGVYGLGYTSRLRTLDLEAGSILGAAQGEMARNHEVTIRFERTVGAKYGAGHTATDSINFRETSYVAGPIPLFTGDKNLKVQPGYRRERVLVVEQDLPLPCNITALFARGQTADG